MKLSDFIKKLNAIADKKGGDFEVVMADGIPVVAPVFSQKYLGNKVIITDENK